MICPLPLLLAALSVLVLNVSAATAQSGQKCAPRPVVLKKLSETYGESRQSIGLSGGNQVVEMFASDSGSWTIVVTLPSGISCITAAGQSFENLAEILPPAGAPA